MEKEAGSCSSYSATAPETYRSIVHESERYKYIRDVGSGNFGLTRLMRDKFSGEFVAVKYIERGDKIDENVQREIINHRSLRHPNIIGFKEVILTPTHLAIVMEYAAGGELYQRISNSGRLSENEARFFFQQLVSGISYSHEMQVCHRDLKLENILLDGSPIPRLKICDFGYSKSSVFHSQPKSSVGTPAYIAPEVITNEEYDGKVADAWSLGVNLYVMLVGAYPFEDPDRPKDYRKMIQRIVSVKYSIPRSITLSPECLHLISRILVGSPNLRMTIPEIKKHEWYLKNLGNELREENTKWYQQQHEHAQQHQQQQQQQEPMQSMESITQIISEATVPPHDPLNTLLSDFWDGMDEDDLDHSDPDFDFESSGEIVTIL